MKLLLGTWLGASCIALAGCATEPTALLGDSPAGARTQADCGGFRSVLGLFDNPELVWTAVDRVALGESYSAKFSGQQQVLPARVYLRLEGATDALPVNLYTREEFRPKVEEAVSGSEVDEYLVARPALDSDAIVLMVAVYRDGSVGVLDPCLEGLDDRFADVARARGLTARSVVEAVIASPEGGLAVAMRDLGSRPPRTYADIPAAERQLSDRTDITLPSSVVQSFRPSSVSFKFPVSWTRLTKEESLSICGRTPLGYTRCAGLQVLATGDPFDFQRLAGVPFELWLLDEAANPQVPLGRLAQLSDQDFSSNVDIRFELRSGVSTPGQLQADAMAKSRPLVRVPS